MFYEIQSNVFDRYFGDIDYTEYDYNEWYTK